jgi:hypothetical protein
LEADDRTKERHYRAWELINAPRGSTGDGGRRDALQDLTKDRVSLAAAPLEQAHLPDIDLQGAILPGANLQGAWLVGTNMQGASLGDANLQDAIIDQTQLDATKGNDQTMLPYGITRPAHWAKAEGPDEQPDAAEDAPATARRPHPASKSLPPAPAGRGAKTGPAQVKAHQVRQTRRLDSQRLPSTSPRFS